MKVDSYLNDNFNSKEKDDDSIQMKAMFINLNEETIWQTIKEHIHVA